MWLPSGGLSVRTQGLTQTIVGGVGAAGLGDGRGGGTASATGLQAALGARRIAPSTAPMTSRVSFRDEYACSIWTPPSSAGAEGDVPRSAFMKPDENSPVNRSPARFKRGLRAKETRRGDDRRKGRTEMGPPPAV